MFKSQITHKYIKHDLSRICQGDICRDFRFQNISANGEVIEIFLPYIIILSQDCDLENSSNLASLYNEVNVEDNQNSINDNQLLPNVIFVSAFPAEKAKEGEHLKKLYNVSQERINSDKWRNIKLNKNERYHFLTSYPDFQIPDLLIDFKLYYTISVNFFVRNYRETYLASIGELFRESLSQRFAFYLNRIGLPDI